MKKYYLFLSFVVVVMSLLMLSTEGNTQPTIPLCSDINVIDSYPAPTEFSGSVHGIAFDGKNLWAAGYGVSLIYKMGFDSNGFMVVVDSIEAPSDNPTGMTFVGNNLFAGADDTLKISEIRTKGKKAGTVKRWFYAPGYPNEDCVGLTLAKGHLYRAS